MAKVHDGIDSRLQAFIAEQLMFFVGSAPLAAGGRVNVSPRGLDSFRVLDAHRCAYLDLTGSGNETSAHLAENGRITVMFCAFSGKPKILRLFGRGRVHLLDSDGFRALIGNFPALPGIRQVVEIDVDRVQTSCGFGVPEGALHPRQTLLDWAERKGKLGVRDYWRDKNRVSIDGIRAPVAALFPDAPEGGDGSSASGGRQAKIRGVAHVSLAVSDVGRSVDFYAGILGLERIDRPDLGFPGAWFCLAPGLDLHLLGTTGQVEGAVGASDPRNSDGGALAPRTADSQPGRRSHLALQVDDLNALLERLRMAGLATVGSRSGRAAAFVEDPDGHVLELLQGAG